ncbi:MAG: alkaline phosphatase D family protein, partial [Planctomycetota bacterium]
LDTRSFRTELARNPQGRPGGRGPYVPNTDTSGTILGEAQWRWLGEQLAKPADVRVLATSIQVVADEHGWETWGNFPHERDRLYRLIDDTNASGLVIVSGDRHLMEISKDTSGDVPYPIVDFTSSGLNWEDEPHIVDEPNTHRLGDALRQINYGVIDIDWNDDNPTETTITLIGRGPEGESIMRHAVSLGDLHDAE